MKDITGILENSTVGVMINCSKSPDVVCLERKNFKDLIAAADIHSELEEHEIEMYLRMVSDEDFISIVEPVFKRERYSVLDGELYKVLLNKKLQKGDKVYFFMKENCLNRHLIRLYLEYQWILKAMAIDYSRYSDTGVAEVYKELFEDNSRILEEIVVKKRYSEGSNIWALDLDKNILVYSMGKKKVMWTQGEAESRFDELNQV